MREENLFFFFYTRAHTHNNELAQGTETLCLR